MENEDILSEEEIGCFCRELVDTTSTCVLIVRGKERKVDNVPTQKCTRCGEEYFSDLVLDEIDAKIDAEI